MTRIDDVLRLMEIWMIGEVTSVPWLRNRTLYLQSPTVELGLCFEIVPSVSTNGLKDVFIGLHDPVDFSHSVGVQPIYSLQ